MHEKDVDAEPEAAVVHDAASVDGADPGGWASGSGDAAGTAGDDDRARAMMPCLLLQAAAAQESSGGSSRAQRSNAGFNRHSKAAFESVVGASGGGGSGGKSKPGTSAKLKVQEGGGSGGAGKRIQCESVELRNGGWLDPIDDADFLRRSWRPGEGECVGYAREHCQNHGAFNSLYELAELGCSVPSSHFLAGFNQTRWDSEYMMLESSAL